MDVARLKLAVDHGFQWTAPARVPRVTELARRIDFQVFAFDMERRTVGRHSSTRPFSASPQIAGKCGRTIKALLPPPLLALSRIGERVEYTLRRGSDKNFRKNRVLVGCNGSSCHGNLLLTFHENPEFL